MSMVYQRNAFIASLVYAGVYAVLMYLSGVTYDFLLMLPVFVVSLGANVLIALRLTKKLGVVYYTLPAMWLLIAITLAYMMYELLIVKAVTHTEQLMDIVVFFPEALLVLVVSEALIQTRIRHTQALVHN